VLVRYVARNPSDVVLEQVTVSDEAPDGTVRPVASVSQPVAPFDSVVANALYDAPQEGIHLFVGRVQAQDAGGNTVEDGDVYGLRVLDGESPIIEASDVEQIFERGQYGFTSLIAAPGEGIKIQSVLDGIEPGGTFDFGSVQTTSSFTEAQTQARPFGPEVPSTDAFDGADFVNIVSVFGGDAVYTFSGVNAVPDEIPDGFYEYGSLADDFLGTVTTIMPPLRRLPLPMTFGTAWSSGESTVQEEGDFFSDTYTRSNGGEVVGYGTLIVPGGSQTEVLVHRARTVERGDTLWAYEFFGPEQLTSATVLVDENDNVMVSPLPGGSEQPAAFFQIGTERAVVEPVPPNLTGTLLDALEGIILTLTDGSDTEGSLRGYQIDYPTANVEIDDSGTPAGFPVVKVSQDDVWVVQAEGLSNFAYEVCLDYSGVSGIDDPSQLAVLKREDAESPWIPQISTTRPQEGRVCAESLTSFSEFALGSGAGNPLPVELVAFTGTASDRSVTLQWSTASESDNAGFEVQRHDAAADRFVTEGFVEGAGTTDEPQAYRFRIQDLGAGMHRFRLRQVDTDGQAAYSHEVTVRVAIEGPYALRTLAPNPARGWSELRLTTQDAQQIRVQVYDLLGRHVATPFRDQVAANRPETIRLRTDGWAPGSYFVRITGERFATTQRLIVLE
jgi:hypothetical protein